MRWFYARCTLRDKVARGAAFAGVCGGSERELEELKRLVEERTAQLTASLQDVATEKQRTENHAREVERLNEGAECAQCRACRTDTHRAAQIFVINSIRIFFSIPLFPLPTLCGGRKAGCSCARTLALAYLRLYALQPWDCSTVPLSGGSERAKLSEIEKGAL